MQKLLLILVVVITNYSIAISQVIVPASTISGAPVEKLTISLPAGKLVVEWDKTRVEVPVES